MSVFVEQSREIVPQKRQPRPTGVCLTRLLEPDSLVPDDARG